MLKSAFGFVALIAIAAATSANASLHVYNFEGGPTGDLGTTEDFVSNNGLTVTVTGYQGSSFAGGGTATSIHRNTNNGLGVLGTPAENRIGRTASAVEWLELDFSPAAGAILESVVFERDPSAGSLDVYEGANLVETISWSADGGGDGTFTHVFQTNVNGSVFSFVANTGEFRLSGVTFAAVPEAGSIFIWSLGGMTILGMLWVRRSRQAA